MHHDFYLAWRYLRFHKSRTAILIACLSLMAFLPLGLHVLLDQGERQIMGRARSTPLLIGAKGSALDLTLNTLYFTAGEPTPITMAEAERIDATGWADALPVYSRFRVRGQPLVGVSLDYFDFRDLVPVDGQGLTMLGDCVLGYRAARSLGLKPGDSLLATPETLFDLAGIYPLKLHVVGVLGEAGTADDEAVFVDLKTVWVMEGLGHGHAEPKQARLGSGQAFGRAEVERSADPRPPAYTEITPENIDSFHFHGDPAGYPISAVIALPHDRRSASLLKGRYVGGDSATQIVAPLQTTQSLLDSIFRIGALFDAVLAAVGGAALLALSLVFSLSLRLRRREMQTIFLLGCGRMTVCRLLAAELGLLALASSLICVAALEAIERSGAGLVRAFLIP